MPVGKLVVADSPTDEAGIATELVVNWRLIENWTGVSNRVLNCQISALSLCREVCELTGVPFAYSDALAHAYEEFNRRVDSYDIPF